MNLLSDTRMTVVFGAVVAVTAAIYVAFGPTAATEKPHEVTGKRKKRKRASRGMPRGLHNSGNTCFVNAILQAASSCPAVLLWLEEIQAKQNDESATARPDLFGDFLTVLKVVNAMEDDDDVANSGEVGDPEVWAPARLFRTLRTHGWIINAGEQDAHEYFQVLFTTLEEELQQRRPRQNSPASLLDCDAVSSSLVDDPEETLDSPEEEKQDDGEQRNGARRHSRQLGTGKRARSRSASGVMVRSGTELSLDVVQRQTKICSSKATPFSGTLTNKVSFRSSGKSKSPTSSIVFNNITLNLPSKDGKGPRSGDAWNLASGMVAAPVTLETLLQMFVTSEAVEAEREQLVKQLTFGRLPECLCFHIQRTAFENGAALKRNDVVLFPTILNMDNYAYNRHISKKKVATSGVTAASSPAGISSVITSPSGMELDDETASVTSWMTNPCEYFNNNYLLRAVVVHLGAMDSGHYVTYRREPESPFASTPPPSSESSKWYYTSDTLVREVQLQEVLKTNPYMLFYEKIHPTSDVNQKLDANE